MRRRLLRLDLLDQIAIGLFLAVAAYTAWVVVDVSASGADPGTDGARALEPSPSVQVAPPEAPSNPPPLGAFRAAASTAGTILVIGDSTGTGPGTWVELVAEDLGDDHQVSLHEWDEENETFEDATTEYGEEGRELEIWNLSYRGVDPDYPDHLDELPEPDVVVLNIGHDRRARAAARAATVTVEAVGERWGDVPTALVLQNPSVGDEEPQQRRAVARLTRFAAEYGDPVIDVYTAFLQSTGGRTLVDDESRPTEAGFRLWADVVDRALGVTTAP